MFYVCVLRSRTSGRLYTGHTSDLTQRVGQHNHGITKFTKNRGPWDILHCETLETQAAAMKRERFLKSGQGREYPKSSLRDAGARSSAE